MSEYITLFGLLLIAFICGLLMLGIRLKKVGIPTLVDRVTLWAIYSFLDFGFISVARLFLLRTSQVYMWTDYKLLIFDLISAIGGVFLIPLILHRCILKRNDRTVGYGLLLLCAIFVHAIGLVYQFWIYRNVNSAIYHMLIPERFVVTSGITVIVYEEIKCVLSKIHANCIDEKQEETMNSSAKKTKRIITCAVSISCVLTTCGYPVFETFVANLDEFSFAAKSVDAYFFLYLLLLCLFLILCIGKLDGRMWECGILGIFSLLTASYVQQMFLNGALFLMDGSDIKIGYSQILSNLLAWIAIFIAIFSIRKFMKNEWIHVVGFVSLAIVVMQLAGGISLVSLGMNNKSTKNDMTEYFSTTGLYEVASDENVIVFVLDKYDEAFMEQVLAIEPDFLEPLEGFTYFSDTVSQFSRTYPSITYMLTNQTFFDLPENTNYYDWAFANCSFWNQLEVQGYETYFYEETAKFIGESERKRAVNYVEQGKCIKEELSFLGCIRSIHMMSCFRAMPYILKDYYSYTAEGINNLVIKERDWEEMPYIVDDAQIKYNLDTKRLSIGNDKKAFRFIHMFGAHPPYSLNRNGEREKESKNLYLEQYMGSMQIVYNYLEKLREVGKYDDSTIIITADHGENFENGNVLPENVNIILFVKPKGETAKELKYSDVYASQDDLLPTLESLLGMESDNKVGIDLFSDEAKSKDRVRYHYFHVVEDTAQIATRTYEIKGNSLDFNNWNATEEYHDFR